MSRKTAAPMAGPRNDPATPSTTMSRNKPECVRPRHSTHSVGSTRQPSPLDRSRIEKLRERQRQHEESDAAHPHAEITDESGAQGRKSNAGNDAEPRAATELDAEQNRRIGAETEEGGVAERHHSAVTHEQIKTH